MSIHVTYGIKRKKTVLTLACCWACTPGQYKSHSLARSPMLPKRDGCAGQRKQWTDLLCSVVSTLETPKCAILEDGLLCLWELFKLSSAFILQLYRTHQETKWTFPPFSNPSCGAPRKPLSSTMASQLLREPGLLWGSHILRQQSFITAHKPCCFSPGSVRHAKQPWYACQVQGLA